MARSPFESTPLTAMQTYDDIMERRVAIDAEHDGLADSGIREADVFVADLQDGNKLVLLDETTQRNNVFKTISAEGGVAVLGDEVTEVVTGSAGSFMMAVADPATRRNMQVTSFVPKPHLVNPLKLEAARENGIAVHADSDSVEEALVKAQAYVKNTPGAAFVHPYDNPSGVAALTIVGEHATNAVDKLRADGKLPSDHEEEYLLQVGGGSLLGGVACWLYDNEPVVNRTVRTARPNRKRNGSLDPRFDGLAVEVPGSIAMSLLTDRRFVQGQTVVHEASVADATRLLYRVNNRKLYEANALVGVAAVLQTLADYPDAPPKTYVTVLTGSNADPAQHEYFMGLDGYESTLAFQERQRNARRRAMAAATWTRFAGEAESLNKRRPVPAVRDFSQPGGQYGASPTYPFRQGLIEPRPV